MPVFFFWFKEWFKIAVPQLINNYCFLMKKLSVLFYTALKIKKSSVKHNIFTLDLVIRILL